MYLALAKNLMKKIICFCLSMLGLSTHLLAQDIKKDTVYIGIYITSIHDIDFKQKEFATTFWLWMRYRNPQFDFYNNLEIPSAKSVDKSFFTMDTTGGMIYVQMKLQCVMKDSWRITNFPFDEQKLRISFENSQHDAEALVFIPDTAGQHFDRRFTLRGWKIDSCIISAGKKTYETAFGLANGGKQVSEYSTFRVRLSVTRDAGGLFWKMFLGMYVAFLISFICFYIHVDSMDSRFGLGVGSLFAVVGNKYIIDSSLPESSSFTLVDTLHGVTLFVILLVIAANAYSLRLIKKDKMNDAIRFDKITAIVILIMYLIVNVWFIWQAKNGNVSPRTP